MENKDKYQPNSLNLKKGADFEEKVSGTLNKRYSIAFYKHAIRIGHPPKMHKFDLVSENERYIVECKKYSWTETGNVPSAKMAFINEAVFYLSHIPKDKQRIVVLSKNNHPKRKETLAEYYFRTYRHLLDGVKILEFDEVGKKLRDIESGEEI